MAAIPRIAESVRVKVERSLRARAILVAFGLRRDGFSLILRSPRAPRSAEFRANFACEGFLWRSSSFRSDFSTIFGVFASNRVDFRVSEAPAWSPA